MKPFIFLGIFLSLFFSPWPASADPQRWQDIDLAQELTPEQVIILEEHLPEIKAMAESGDVDAQLKLAGLYSSPKINLAHDYALAAKWLRRAAEQGNARAELFLSNLYGVGLGVPKDENASFKWAMKSAEQGYTDAETAVGALYFAGLGTKKDLNEPQKWFNKSAAKGDPQAQAFLEILTKCMVLQNQSEQKSCLLKNGFHPD